MGFPSFGRRLRPRAVRPTHFSILAVRFSKLPDAILDLHHAVFDPPRFRPSSPPCDSLLSPYAVFDSHESPVKFSHLLARCFHFAIQPVLRIFSRMSPISLESKLEAVRHRQLSARRPETRSTCLSCESSLGPRYVSALAPALAGSKNNIAIHGIRRAQQSAFWGAFHTITLSLRSTCEHPHMCFTCLRAVHPPPLLAYSPSFGGMMGRSRYGSRPEPACRVTLLSKTAGGLSSGSLCVMPPVPFVE